MNDSPDEPAETPMQKALRMKKAALQGRRTRPEMLRPEQNKSAPKGASKPWMKR